MSKEEVERLKNDAANKAKNPSEKGCYMLLDTQLIEEYKELFPHNPGSTAEEKTNSYLYEQFTLKCGISTLRHKLYAQKLKCACIHRTFTDCHITTNTGYGDL